MKKLFFSLSCLLLLVSALGLRAQDKKFAMYAVAFYNLENLFDTVHDVTVDTIYGALKFDEASRQYKFSTGKADPLRLYFPKFGENQLRNFQSRYAKGETVENDTLLCYRRDYRNIITFPQSFLAADAQAPLPKEIDQVRIIRRISKNDYEYLPDGTNTWGTMKYTNKLKNMSTVLSELATDKLPMGPAIIGVSEIENRHTLEDLAAQPALAKRGLKVILEEGPDWRGVDVGFLYNPKIFKYMHHQLVPFIYPEVQDSARATRGFLIATGNIGGELTHVIVNHWPSRGAPSPARELAGRQVRVLKDSLLRENPTCHVIIMGDINDDPDNKSMAVCLGAKRKAKECGPEDLWNPFWDTLRKQGVGSLCYDGKWNLFDQIVFTGNMLGDDRSTLKYYKHEIFKRDYLMQQEGKYKGYPLRTHAGGVWMNGYSDHLPSIVYFVKEVK